MSFGNTRKLIAEFEKHINAILKTKKQEAIQELRSVLAASLAKMNVNSDDSKNKETQEAAKIGEMLVDMVEIYLREIDSNTVKNIILDYMDNPYDPKKYPINNIALIIGRTGPPFKKIIQHIAGTKTNLGDFESIIKMIESDSRTVPPTHFDHVLESATNELFKIKSNKVSDEIFDWQNLLTDISKRAFGGGSFAQVHQATYKGHQQDIEMLIRVSPIDIKEEIESEYPILKTMAEMLDKDNSSEDLLGLPKLAPLAKFYIKLVCSELDGYQTAKKQIDAYRYYHHKSIDLKYWTKERKVRFIVPAIYATSKKVSIQDKVSGKKLSDVPREFAEVAVRALTKLWFKEAFLGSGFFHGDLQEGNFMIKENPKTKEIEVSIIDFGIAGILSKKQQNTLFKFILAIKARDVEMILELYNELGIIPRGTDINSIRTKLQAEKELELNNTFIIGLEGGWEIDVNLVGVARTIFLIDGFYKRTNWEIMKYWQVLEESKTLGPRFLEIMGEYADQRGKILGRDLRSFFGMDRW